MENGVKPIWVFDGKPPEMKSKELDKRKELLSELWNFPLLFLGAGL
jgi:flap endonuclease-1